jgi:hypothetical protein
MSRGQTGRTNGMKAIMGSALAAAALGLAGCAITQNVRPVAAPDIALLCIKKNPDVLMSEFVTELKSQVEAKGMKALVYDAAAPADCRHRLEYSANWRWDLAMYLVFADLRVYDRELLIGQANYDARGGGGRLDKFGPTAGKLQRLLDELFARR